jgi:hypothetical protein
MGLAVSIETALRDTEFLNSNFFGKDLLNLKHPDEYNFLMQQPFWYFLIHATYRFTSADRYTPFGTLNLKNA